jgi:hypothetical protein
MLAGEQIMADLAYNGKMILFPARLPIAVLVDPDVFVYNAL